MLLRFVYFWMRVGVEFLECSFSHHWSLLFFFFPPTRNNIYVIIAVSRQHDEPAVTGSRWPSLFFAVVLPLYYGVACMCVAGLLFNGFFLHVFMMQFRYHLRSNFKNNILVIYCRWFSSGIRAIIVIVIVDLCCNGVVGRPFSHIGVCV